jgi:GNAT superfamily N-acetyltransferase
VSGVALPAGLCVGPLRRAHRRRGLHCGEQAVDDWLATKAVEHQEKRLSVTKVLLSEDGQIAGYYTLATGQVDFGDLPPEVAKALPRRLPPVAVLAWLGVSTRQQHRGLGRLLLAQALRDCWEAGRTFAFVAVILDCLSDRAKSFYEQWGFRELPGHPYRLFVGANQLDAMMRAT